MQVLLSVHTLSQDVHTTLQYKNLDIQQNTSQNNVFVRLAIKTQLWLVHC